MTGFSVWLKGVRGKLLFLVSFATVMFAVLGVVSYRTIVMQGNELTAFNNVTALEIRYTGAMESSMNAIVRYFWAAYVSKDDKETQDRLALAKDNVKRFDERLEQLLALPIASEVRDIMKPVQEGWKEAKASVPEIITELAYNKPEHDKIAHDIIAGKLRSNMAVIGKNLREVLDLRNASMKENAIKSEKEAATVRITILAVSVSAIVILFLFGLWVASNLANALEKVAQQISDSGTQVSSASEQISNSAQQLAATSSEQASAVEETSASMEEISAMVENNARNSEQGLELVDAVLTNTLHGDESMQEFKLAMEDILESNKKIEKLVKVIEEIGGKTAIIDEIVFQTKLLSFNASVEAERAGEHGRGFAVVAQEVGNLAQMSGKAALEISSIVKVSTKEAKEIASENREKVERGGKLVDDAATVLGEIRSGAEKVQEGSRQIAAASKEQATGIKQVTSAIENINKATQETAATSEEAAGAGEELSSQARHLDTLVAQLGKLVNGSGRAKNINTTKVQTVLHDNKNMESFTPITSNVVSLQPKGGKTSTQT